MNKMNLMARKKLIIDVGAGEGTFTERLKRKNPTKEVRGIDRIPRRAGIIAESMGSHFLNMSKEEAERLHAVWANHINLTSSEANQELRILAQKIPKKVPVIITIRQERLAPTIYSIEAAGLKVFRHRPISEKMIMSEDTKKFFDESKNNPEKRPIRIVALKQ